MPAKSKSQTITKRSAGRRLPWHRPPTHPFEMLAEKFLKQLAITKTELAWHLDFSYSRLNNIIQDRASITPDTAIRRGLSPG